MIKVRRTPTAPASLAIEKTKASGSYRKKDVVDQLISDFNGKCYLCHADVMEDAQMVAGMIEEKFPNLNGNVSINNVGTTIGSHTGPGVVAIFFWGTERD